MGTLQCDSLPYQRSAPAVDPSQLLHVLGATAGARPPSGHATFEEHTAVANTASSSAAAGNNSGGQALNLQMRPPERGGAPMCSAADDNHGTGLNLAAEEDMLRRVIRLSLQGQESDMGGTPPVGRDL